MAEFDIKALVVVPHPDDAEIQCGGAIARWAREGHRIVYVVCTNGDKGTEDPAMTPERLAQLREKEQVDAARVLGVSQVVFLRYPDGELEDTREFRGKLVRLLRTHRPEIVLAPDPYRKSFYQHRDHRIAGLVAMDAVFPYARDRLHFPEHEREGLKPHKVAEVYFFGADDPDTFIDISGTLDLKIASVKAHVSQMSNPGRDVEKWVRERAAQWGEKAKVPFAEAYRCMATRR